MSEFNLEGPDLIKKIKKSNISDLYNLSKKIRSFLIDNVSNTGGHLSSNLGAVELIVSIHRVYNSPIDRIIYDVGHQAYVHKILTGRAGDFKNLRKKDGLSGFPKREESSHDIYDTGHSSTSLSAGLGIATSRDLSGEDYEVISVIGDGSMTGGISFEALNNIGSSGKKIRIILNDNGMSISKNVGGLSSHLLNLSTSKKYLNAKESMKNKLPEIPFIGKKIAGGLTRSRDKVKFSLLTNQGILFEDLGIKYMGPVDGHDYKQLIRAFNNANKIDGPTIVHVITKKGKGYEWSEKYPRKFHGIGPFDKYTGESIKKSNLPTYSAIFGDKITEIAEKNDKVVAVAAAMGTATGLGKFYEKFPNRYFDVGIAEQHAVIFGTGMAINGYIPVIAIYSSFLQRAFDQLIEDVALHNLHIIFAIDRAGLVGADGETHQGQFDISYMNMIPNMTILTPASASQLEEMLDYAINECNTPVSIRYPRGESNDLKLPFNGKNNRIEKGEDITIYAVGTMISIAIKVRDLLSKYDINAGIVLINIVKPYDFSLSEFEKDSNTKLLAIIEDGIFNGGFAEKFISKNNNLNKEILNFNLPDAFIKQGTVDEQLDSCGMSPEKITDKILEVFQK